jgi:hypothetical protein
MSVNTGSVQGVGISSSGTVGTTSAQIVAPDQFAAWVTVQNTHASNKLSISFNASATTSDFTLAPGASITLPYGPGNSLNGIGSAAGTTYALIGF